MNRLINETSPYLQQHAHNPVDWFPWGEEALTKAKVENKPILVSIGYSACHWCHVMEKESFENPHIAEIMNRVLVCIKVDREERPDIDAIYMDAVQAMGAQGGWPLNVFLMPDAQPFYGLTYLPPQNFAQLITSIEKAYATNYEELKKSAEGFTANLQQSEIQKYGLEAIRSTLTLDELDISFESLQRNFDFAKGGMNRAPKFPMPSIYSFLLRYYDLSQNPEALRHIETSLHRIALGGIYDHVGGGWARYSVDDEWFIPHFEKMLYDNGQLLSIYSEAYRITKNPLFLHRIQQTIQWATNELLSPEFGFYSALDADSEGVEGKYYIWKADELKTILGNEYEAFAELYSITEEGNWEHHWNHLHLTHIPKEIFTKEGFTEQYLQILDKLATARSSRIRPGLDDKILASWNGLMLKGIVDAYKATGDEQFKELALKNGSFLVEKMLIDGKLYHSYKNGKATINGFLEDYASVALAFINLYQISFDIQWIQHAKTLLDYSVAHFYSKEDEMFYFTDDTAEVLIARKIELFDNVIPSSNSIVAHALYQLGTILTDDSYLNIALKMASKVFKLVTTDAQWVSNWAALHCELAIPTAEVVISGPNSAKYAKDLQRFYIPNMVVMAPDEALPLTVGKESKNNQTTIYVCYDKTCQLPVQTIEDAIKQIEMI